MTETANRLCRALTIATLVALLVLPGAAFSEEPTPAPQTSGTAEPAAAAEHAQANAAEAEANRLPPASITHHTISLGGETVAYSAKAGTLPLHDVHGKTLATVFYVAYMREPQDTKRPVTFVFNGGPGAASAYLHLGGIGPKAVEVTARGELLGPPPRLVDNDSSWLDFTDLVFVDPVGTGYSRASEGKDEGDFWSVEHDTDSLADFIRLYLIDAARMTSPVFLAGESYGGFRAAKVARALQRDQGIVTAGIVMLSPMLEGWLTFGDDESALRADGEAVVRYLGL